MLAAGQKQSTCTPSHKPSHYENVQVHQGLLATATKSVVGVHSYITAHQPFASNKQAQSPRSAHLEHLERHTNMDSTVESIAWTALLAKLSKASPHALKLLPPQAQQQYPWEIAQQPLPLPKASAQT